MNGLNGLKKMLPKNFKEHDSKTRMKILKYIESWNKITAYDLKQERKWCEDNFGKSLYRFCFVNDELLLNDENNVWEDWGGTFYFKNKEDAALFKLTWG